MQDQDFEWRDGKAAENLRLHGIAFDKAVKAFAVEWIDDAARYGEERFNLSGMSEGVIPARHLHGTRRPDQDHLGAASGAT
jgi:uncharacterized DUF497 family protein